MTLMVNLNIVSSCPQLLPVAGIIRSSAEIHTATKINQGDTQDTSEMSRPLGILICGGSGTGESPSSCLRHVIEKIHKCFHYGRRETMFHFEAHFASDEAHKVVAEVCSSCDCYAAKATRRYIQPMGS